MIRKSLEATKLLFRHLMARYLPALTEVNWLELYEDYKNCFEFRLKKNIKYLFILLEKSVITPIMNNFIKTYISIL